MEHLERMMAAGGELSYQKYLLRAINTEKRGISTSVKNLLDGDLVSTTNANTIACSERGIHLCLIVNKAENKMERAG